jgi:hypothetical protein
MGDPRIVNLHTCQDSMQDLTGVGFHKAEGVDQHATEEQLAFKARKNKMLRRFFDAGLYIPTESWGRHPEESKIAMVPSFGVFRPFLCFSGFLFSVLCLVVSFLCDTHIAPDTYKPTQCLEAYEVLGWSYIMFNKRYTCTRAPHFVQHTHTTPVHLYADISTFMSTPRDLYVDIFTFVSTQM